VDTSSSVPSADETVAKHVLGLWEGTTETEIACKAMLEDLSARGLKPNRSRLFIIDDKGLRAALRSAFGNRALVRRCQVRKVRNGAASVHSVDSSWNHFVGCRSRALGV
jgi:transposase-like protein